MKKVILSAVVAIAVIGAVAAKVNSIDESYYYKTATVSCTLKTDFPDGTCDGSGNVCQATVGNETATLFTVSGCPPGSEALKQ